MITPTTKVQSVEQYIKSFPTATQKLLKQLRTVIKKTVPAAEEVISYNMPAYKYQGMLVYYAAYEKHIGFYPMPSAITKFKKEFSVYKSAKGSVQFPLDKALPVELIAEVLKFRVKENEKVTELKVKKKK
jgi:uncharacterized protein YdhG (YjbR/CyaY superfamily)